MAFDCVFVDFNVNNDNKKIILDRFPYANVVPFVKSYKDILKNFWQDTNTEFFWLLTDLNDYSAFDFDYIPEQFQKNQIHVWHSTASKEGDTFLINKNEFGKQIDTLKNLRDFKDINYHFTHDLVNYVWPMQQYNLNNLLTNIKNQKERYTYYYYQQPVWQTAPSFWEELKIYVSDQNKFNILVPKFPLKEELYEFPRVVKSDTVQTDRPAFDICFIHNSEPFWQKNYERLKEYSKDVPNKIHLIENVQGRTLAYKTAAEASDTEYFYAVFSKISIDPVFRFDFIPDTFKTPRHYIFDCYNSTIDYTYGHQAVILYNKQMVLDNSGSDLDFTLSQQHDHIKLLSGNTTFHEDETVCYRTTFREIVKLLYWQENKPTIENNFVLKTWLKSQQPTVFKACQDAKKFYTENKDNYNKLFGTYDWNTFEKII
jgi:hypothetical protein